MQTNRAGHSFVRLLARTGWLAGSAALWVGYAAFTFGVSSLVAADSARRGFDNPAWPMAPLIAAIPLGILLSVMLGMRREKAPLLGRDGFGQGMAAVQAAGVALVIAAVAVPPLGLWPYFHPGGTIDVDNRSQYGALVSLEGDFCRPSEPVSAQSSARLTFVSSSLECWGSEPHTLTVMNANGRWSCEWEVARRSDRLTVTDDGPDCPVTDYTPGILRVSPTSGGPPWSPPAADRTPARAP